MDKIEEKIKRLEEKLGQAKALKQQKEARVRTAENKIKREAGTTFKILSGAALLSCFKDGSLSNSTFQHILMHLSGKDRSRLEYAKDLLGVEIKSDAT